MSWILLWPHFTDEEIEAQKSDIICPTSHCLNGELQDLNPSIPINCIFHTITRLYMHWKTSNGIQQLRNFNHFLPAQSLESSASKLPVHVQFPFPTLGLTQWLWNSGLKTSWGQARPSLLTNRQMHTYQWVPPPPQTVPAWQHFPPFFRSRSSQDAPEHTGSGPAPIGEIEILLLSSNQSTRCCSFLCDPPVHLQLNQKLLERTHVLSPKSRTVSL